MSPFARRGVHAVAAIAIAAGLLAPGAAGAAPHTPTQSVELAHSTDITSPNNGGVAMLACKAVVDTYYGPLYRLSVVAFRPDDSYNRSTQVSVSAPGQSNYLLMLTPDQAGWWLNMQGYELWAGNSSENVVHAYPDAALDTDFDPFSPRLRRVEDIAWCNGNVGQELISSAYQGAPQGRNLTNVGQPNSHGLIMAACRLPLAGGGWNLRVVMANNWLLPDAHGQLFVATGTWPADVTVGEADTSTTGWYAGQVAGFEIYAGSDPSAIIWTFPDRNYIETEQQRMHGRYPRLGQVGLC